MLGNCENMVLISSTTNEWPQQHQNNNNNNQLLLDDKRSLMAAAAASGRVVATTADQKQQQIIQQEQNLQQQQIQLKCPRCDSSNTKFCYYNNYSLSQPRHFCKACKRYWTRGGTLRNVPVGGGCRKNKRVKRPSSASSSAIDNTPSSSSSAPSSNPNPSSIQSHMDMSSMFYGLNHTNPSDLSYSRFNPRVSNIDTVSGFDLQPQLSALGLGFSSSEFNGFNNNPNTSNQLLSSYPMFGSSATSNSPTMASLLSSSSFQNQQKYLSSGLKDLRGGISSSFHGLGQYQDLQMQGNSSAGKEVKMEEAQGGGGGRIDWDLHGQNQTQHHDQINSSDPNLYWSGGSGFGGAWLDPGNIGSSVPSLI